VNISSRTPEGEGNLCPICRNALKIEPSRPGDAPCPFCGTLLWFNVSTSRGGPEPKKQTRPIITEDRVRVRKGTFAAMEGKVEQISEHSRRVRIIIMIFGHPVPVELEESELELVE
jgi:transcription antitermination factor NusG